MKSIDTKRVDPWIALLSIFLRTKCSIILSIRVNPEIG